MNFNDFVFSAQNEYDKLYWKADIPSQMSQTQRFKFKSPKRVKEVQFWKNFIEQNLFNDEDFTKRIKKIWGKQEGGKKINSDDVLKWIRLNTIINHIDYTDFDGSDLIKHDLKPNHHFKNKNQKWVVYLEHELKILKEIVEHVKHDIPLGWINAELSEKDIKKAAEERLISRSKNNKIENKSLTHRKQNKFMKKIVNLREK